MKKHINLSSSGDTVMQIYSENVDVMLINNDTAQHKKIRSIEIEKKNPLSVVLPRKIQFLPFNFVN